MNTRELLEIAHEVEKTLKVYMQTAQYHDTVDNTMTKDQLKQLLDNMIDISNATIRKQQFGTIIAAYRSGVSSRHDCVSLCEDYDFSLSAFSRLTKD